MTKEEARALLGEATPRERQAAARFVVCREDLQRRQGALEAACFELRMLVGRVRRLRAERDRAAVRATEAGQAVAKVLEERRAKEGAVWDGVADATERRVDAAVEACRLHTHGDNEAKRS